MKVTASAAMLGAMLLGSGAAQAAFLSGSQLYDLCRKKESMEQAGCMGYIDGVVDAFLSWRTQVNLPGCLPAGVTGVQLRDRVVQWLDKNPQARGDTADNLVRDALFDAWPACAR